MTPAETLLQELGITEPEEIDLEAIAFHVGARVRYRPLSGCEAHILGCRGKAIITVKTDVSAARKRFSIAHELGHWRFHRGQTLVCRVDDYRPRNGRSPEKVADGYAADLLMPRYLFDPLARQVDRFSFKAIGDLAKTFGTSLTATAIRLIDLDLLQGFLICHTPRGRKWFARAPSVDRAWFPRDDIDPKSSAFGIQFGGRPDDSTLRKVSAGTWLNQFDADRFDVLEQTNRIGRDEILSIVLVTDMKMLNPI